MNVGIWIRVSTEDQAKGESPKHHEERARAYAAFKGWNVVEKYDLSGMTGKSVMDYPETKRMLGDVESCKINGLIFSKLARLARNTKELLDFSDYFKKHNADLISLSEAIDTSSPAGRLFYTMIAALAEWEREEIAARISAAIPVRAKMNKLLGSKPPMGFTVRDKKLVVDESQVTFIQSVFNIFIETRSYFGTAKRLGRQGPAGQMMVRKLIKDPIYKGQRIANRFHGHKLKPQDQWIYVNVEPIVSVELWDKCQLIAKEISKKWPSSGKHLFTGLVGCICGSKLYKDKKLGEVYRCRNCNFQIGEETIVEQYRAALTKIVIEPEQVRPHKDFKKLLEGTLLSKKEIEKRLTAIERQVDALVDLYSKKLLNEFDFKGRMDKLSAEREALDNELAVIEAKAVYYQNGDINYQYFLDTAKSLNELWDIFAVDERIEIIKEITSAIEVSENEMKIKLYNLPGILPESRSQSAVSISASLPWPRLPYFSGF